MKDISFDYYMCDDTIKVHGESRIAERWDTLYKEMSVFIELHELSDVARIDKLLLSTAIMDYLNDIRRLKEFHKILTVNSIKVHAYTVYWLLRRKPIQISCQTDRKELITLNERFALQYLCNYLSVRERKSHILLRSEESKGIENFAGMLLYYMIYRLHDAHSLEMMLVAFFAGQIYERTDVDITQEFHEYD